MLNLIRRRPPPRKCDGHSRREFLRAGSLGLFGLTLPDPDLQDMIVHPELVPAGEFAEIIAAVRAFHGLESVKQS